MSESQQVQEFRWQRRHGQLHGHVTPPKETHFTTGGSLSSGHGLSIDLAELDQALTKLTKLTDEFDTHSASAASLPQVLPAGTGPIGDAVGQRFNHRLSDHGGLRYAISAMQSQVHALQENLATTVQRYVQVEDSATANISSAANPNGEC